MPPPKRPPTPVTAPAAPAAPRVLPYLTPSRVNACNAGRCYFYPAPDAQYRCGCEVCAPQLWCVQCLALGKLSMRSKERDGAGEPVKICAWCLNRENSTHGLMYLAEILKETHPAKWLEIARAQLVVLARDPSRNDESAELRVEIDKIDKQYSLDKCKESLDNMRSARVGHTAGSVDTPSQSGSESASLIQSSGATHKVMKMLRTQRRGSHRGK